MNQLESKFRKEVVGLITDGGGHASSVESHATSAGIPDIDFCWDGLEGHIELKVFTETNKKALRPSQVRWFKKRIEAGGKPWIMIKLNWNGKILLIKGKNYHHIQSHITKQKLSTLDSLAMITWEKMPTVQQLQSALIVGNLS